MPSISAPLPMTIPAAPTLSNIAPSPMTILLEPLVIALLPIAIALMRLAATEALVPIATLSVELLPMLVPLPIATARSAAPPILAPGPNAVVLELVFGSISLPVAALYVVPPPKAAAMLWPRASISALAARTSPEDPRVKARIAAPPLPMMRISDRRPPCPLPRAVAYSQATTHDFKVAFHTRR
ncbi:hypothetical protein FQZ97_788490 [compost metagenome]